MLYSWVNGFCIKVIINSQEKDNTFKMLEVERKKWFSFEKKWCYSILSLSSYSLEPLYNLSYNLPHTLSSKLIIRHFFYAWQTFTYIQFPNNARCLRLDWNCIVPNFKRNSSSVNKKAWKVTVTDDFSFLKIDSS